MTATTPPRTYAPPTIKTPMLAYLQGLHDQWLREVRGVLEPARAEGTGIWPRWRAIEYLDAGFRRRFERERRAVFSMHGRLSGAQAGHLWAAGELLAQLLEGVRGRVGLCQRDEQFSSFGLTVLNALEYWCGQVEEALGRIRWGEVSPESRHLFEVITFDEVSQGG